MSKLAKPRILWASAMLAWLVSASDAFAQEPIVIWVKAATQSLAMEADFAACKKSTDTIVVVHVPYGFKIRITAPSTVESSSGDAAVGQVHESWLGSRIDRQTIRATALRKCMLSLGYHAIRLTPTEEADLLAQTTPQAVDTWVKIFYNQADFDKRLAAEIPPPLPDARVEAFAYGAVRLDPASIAPATGPVGLNGVVLTGTMSHRQTARNLVDVPSDLNSGGYFSAGMILHQAVLSEKDGTRRTYWCGAYKAALGSTPACARKSDQGYALAQPEGPRWLTTGLDLHGAPGTADPDAFRIELSETDLLGPISFGLALRKLTNAAVMLEAVVSQGNDHETLWQKTVPFDTNGKAILPFWTHRLVLTRTDKGIIVAYPEDGDGTGWP